MLTLEDGPVEGTYLCQRAPLFLRAVIDWTGHKDVLDLLTDDPDSLESIYIYKMTENRGVVHINRGRSGSGFYVRASYKYLEDVDGESLRSTKAWRQWAASQIDGRVNLETGEIVN